jgi:F0F1-type ATP synthase gamma subunit
MSIEDAKEVMKRFVTNYNAGKVKKVEVVYVERIVRTNEGLGVLRYQPFNPCQNVSIRSH